MPSPGRAGGGGNAAAQSTVSFDPSVTSSPSCGAGSRSAATTGGVDERLAELIVARVPSEFIVDGWIAWTADEAFGDKLVGLDCPLLLAKHEGCLLYTDAGFEDALAALPRAETAAFDDPRPAAPRSRRR